MNQLFETLVHSYIAAHPETAARTIESLPPDEAAKLLEELPLDDVGPVAERLTPHAAAAILEHLTPKRTANLLRGMPEREAGVILRYLDVDRREDVLLGLPETDAVRLRALVEYPPETAAGLMDPQVVSLPIDLNVRESIAVLQRAPRQALYYLYVTDRHGVLQGVLNMRSLLLSKAEDPILPMVHRDVASIPAMADREEVAEMMQNRGFFALPVVDDNGRLLGVVKHDEVIDAVQEEAFEDLQRMVGAGGDESAMSPVRTVVARRLPWLYVNLLTAFLAASVIGLFEGLLARVSALAVLLPIVSGQGGNSGSQTLAIVLRGLALREILPGSAWRVIIKELLAGIFNGVALAVVTGSIVYFWDGRVAIGAVIGLAMIVTLACAAVAGAAIPILLRRFGLDPAQSSTIFLTTVTDIVGFASFLGFASLFMRWIE